MMPTNLFIQPETTPSLDLVRTLFRDKHHFARGIVESRAESFGAEWVLDCEEALGKLFPTRESIEFALKGYSAFALDAMRRQKRFEKELTYVTKSYKEASEEVYLNFDYMLRQYLPGLLLSHYFWPHHYRQLKFFETAFLAPMKLGNDRTFAEVGIGTALYSRLLLQKVPDSQGVGFDISPAVKRFAGKHLAAFGLDSRYRIQLQDVVAQGFPQVPWLVCVEVLEHLEDPVAFLKALRKGLAPGGKAFITAALDAPNADHIFLYRKPEEVLVQLETVGFVLEQFWTGAAYPPAEPGLPVPLVAAFIVI